MVALRDRVILDGFGADKTQVEVVSLLRRVCTFLVEVLLFRFSLILVLVGFEGAGTSSGGPTNIIGTARRPACAVSTCGSTTTLTRRSLRLSGRHS
jgi:hypothetical protein